VIADPLKKKMKIIPWVHIQPRYRRLLDLIMRYRLRLFAAMACMLLLSGAKAASLYLIKPAVDDIFVNKDEMMLVLIPIAILFVYLVIGASAYGQEYLMNYVGRSIIRRLREMLYACITDLPLSFFQSEKTGVLMSRITNDVNIVKTMVSTAVTSALRDAFTIIGLLALIFYLDWKLAAVAFIVLPVAFYPIVVFGKRARRISTGLQELMADLNTFLHETFAGAKIVKAFGMETHEKESFFKKTRGLFRQEMKEVRIDAMASPVMEFIGAVGIAFIIWYGGFRVIGGQSTPGTFFAFLGAAVSLYAPVKKISKLNNAIQKGLAATDRIFDILEKKSEIASPTHPAALQGRTHRVTFAHVDFAYAEEMVLHDINLDVQPGEILALVGTSGGGKTSLVNLLPRFYDVSAGAVQIDGVDIRRLSIAELRSRIAIVTQEPILFNDTVRNNIAYGRPQASEAAIAEAARAAYALDFIQAFPDGFDTTIGELGSRLSGGEKQRLCIARALLKDAPILILDEATSSLDTESEALVQKALENLMQGRTTFVIAHRLSTISYAHRIAVIAQGRIVEGGSHSELMERRGEFYRLYQMQFHNGDVIAEDARPRIDCA
jgi:subfamily B ATP-binding cassette protein MsbA